MAQSLTRIEFFKRLEERSKLLQLTLAHVVEHTDYPVTFTHVGQDFNFKIDFCKVLEPIVYETILRMIEGVYQEQ